MHALRARPGASVTNDARRPVACATRSDHRSSDPAVHAGRAPARCSGLPGGDALPRGSGRRRPLPRLSGQRQPRDPRSQSARRPWFAALRAQLRGQIRTDLSPAQRPMPGFISRPISYSAILRTVGQTTLLATCSADIPASMTSTSCSSLVPHQCKPRSAPRHPAKACHRHASGQRLPRIFHFAGMPAGHVVLHHRQRLVGRVIAGPLGPHAMFAWPSHIHMAHCHLAVLTEGALVQWSRAQPRQIEAVLMAQGRHGPCACWRKKASSFEPTRPRCRDSSARILRWCQAT